MIVINDSYTHPSAAEIINQEELEKTVNTFGSFFTMVTNKPISCVTFFLLLNQNPEIRSCIERIADVSWYELVNYLAKRYPVLNKSKKIKYEHDLSEF
jgi:hypothetical protein